MFYKTCASLILYRCRCSVDWVLRPLRASNQLEGFMKYSANHVAPEQISNARGPD